MASPHGQPSPALIDRLSHQSYRFDFFQAVRLLSRHHTRLANEGQGVPRQLVGADAPPAVEDVRFRTVASLAFPASPITTIGHRKNGTRAAESASGETTQLATSVSEAAHPGHGPSPPEMHISFFGLTGPAGVLPELYTRRLLQQLRDGSPILHEFFDLFHHRLISHWYRAWEKYHVPFAWESARARPQRGEDQFTLSLLSLIGLGTRQERNRLSVSGETLAFYTGHFAGSARTASGLEALLTDVFGVQTEVCQFQGQWLYLHESDCSRLPDAANPDGRFCRLGEDFVAGSRVRDVQSRFRIRLGPVDLEQFNRLLPHGDDCQALKELARLYVGAELDFDIQPVLKGSQLPPLKLVDDPVHAPRLGWNTWLRSRPSTGDADDVVFDADEAAA